MSITRLTGFTGEAEVLGGLVAVEYRDGTGLTLKVPMDFAHKLLDALRTGTLGAVRLDSTLNVPATTAPERTALDDQKLAGPPPAQPERKVKKTDKPPEANKDSPKPLDTKAPDTAPAPTPMEVAGQAKDLLDKAGMLKAEAPKPPEAKDNVVQLKAPAGAAANAAANGEVHPDIARAGKLRDVVAVLQDQGHKTIEALTVECERLKPHVALLSRIPNLKERITRTLEVMGEASGA